MYEIRKFTKYKYAKSIVISLEQKVTLFTFGWVTTALKGAV